MRSPEAQARRAISSRPSLLRDEPPRNRHPFGARALRVIALLEAGHTRLEAAREVGLDKANVRVIELRARRRGMLAGVETRVDPTSPDAKQVPVADPLAGPCIVRLPRVLPPKPPRPTLRDRIVAELRLRPDEPATWTAERIGCSVYAVVAARRSIGMPVLVPGGAHRRGDKNPARTAIMRLQRAVGCTLADIAREHGLTKERVRQLLAGDDYRARRRTA